jgi:hypothetical protein
MVSNQGWSEEHLQPQTKGMHTVKEMDMMAVKLDLLVNKMDEGSHPQIYNLIHALVRTSHAKLVEMVDTWGMTTPRPLRTVPTSIKKKNNNNNNSSSSSSNNNHRYHPQRG